MNDKNRSHPDRPFKSEYIKIWLGRLDDWQKLTNEEIGELVMAGLKYLSSDNIPEFSDRCVDYAWSELKRQINIDESNYQDISKRNSDNMKKRWSHKARQEHPEAKSETACTEKPNKFTPPTLDEVKAYCKQRGNHVDAKAWYSHYESNGWLIGKAKMKDWKAAVRTWEKNDVCNKQAKSNPYYKVHQLPAWAVPVEDREDTDLIKEFMKDHGE
jgi:hypothetical protein